jgi:hypothetical protein
MPRAGTPAPHCFTFQKGEALCQQYADMLPTGSAEPASVYCCVKSFVRDVKLQQPPLLCLRPAQLLRLDSMWPEEILDRHPLTEREVADAVKLSRLCQDKYDMPRAAAALRSYLTDRNYSVPALTWLQRLTGLITFSIILLLWFFKFIFFLFR